MIDLLERDPNVRVCLVAHYDGGQASPHQALLHTRLAGQYGADRVVLRRLQLRPAPFDHRQQSASPPIAEMTSRGRSIVWLSAALVLASSLGPDVPVYVPANGHGALAVPLTRARSGSASLRSAHPHFLRLLRDGAAATGVMNPIRNPYLFSTKGEMLRDCSNPDLLRELLPLTVSCSYPESATMQQRSQSNCGYCYACLVRRASLAAVGWDDEDFAWDALQDPRLVDAAEHQRGVDLRAVVNGVFADRPDSDILRNAPLASAQHEQHVGVWRRGNVKVRTWIEQGARGQLGDAVQRLGPIATGGRT